LVTNHSISRHYGVFGNMWKKFRGEKESDDQYLVGEDQYGNTYYEKQPSSEASLRMTRRWIKYPGTSDVDDFKGADNARFVSFDSEIPVEWRAWLQMKRKSPPTIEEILRNEAIKMRTIKRAMDLEKQEKDETDVVNNLSSHKQEEFPVYPEYETKIGEYRQNDSPTHKYDSKSNKK
jgi:NADH dehydrogenase [ubiquinone] 1 alpha subcomplex assembly factor 2